MKLRNKQAKSSKCKPPSASYWQNTFTEITLAVRRRTVCSALRDLIHEMTFHLPRRSFYCCSSQIFSPQMRKLWMKMDGSQTRRMKQRIYDFSRSFLPKRKKLYLQMLFFKRCVVGSANQHESQHAKKQSIPRHRHSVRSTAPTTPAFTLARETSKWIQVTGTS